VSSFIYFLFILGFTLFHFFISHFIIELPADLASSASSTTQATEAAERFTRPFLSFLFKRIVLFL
jgi:hypothetical protein